MDTPPVSQGSNFAVLIVGIIVLFILAVATVSQYGNVRTQPWYVSVACIVGWCFPFWIVLLVPLDYASTLYDHCVGQCRVPYSHVSEAFLYIAWRTLYWTSFCLTWAVIPMTQAYVNTGDFGFTRRLKSAVRVNLQFYSIYLVLGVAGLIYLVIGSGYTTREKIQGFAMALSNSWGLFLVINFMGYGLVSVPRSLWYSGNVHDRLRKLYATASRVKEECIDSEMEFNELAKTMNAIHQHTTRSNPFLRDRVDQMIARFPFVTQQEYVDRDNTAVVPRTVTEDYLVSLNKSMILAMRMKDRKLALWNNLLNEAFYLQDIVTNQENSDHLFVSSLRPVKERTRWWKFMAWLEWWWRLRMETLLHRLLAIVFAALSVCILWSELVFNVQYPLLSVVAIALRACGFNYAAVELIIFFTLVYMCLCIYSSLFKVRFFNLYLLIPNHHTDENSLLWFTGYLCKMMAPLCYNFMNLAGNFSGSSANDSVFREFMGRANLIPFLGETFTQWFPVVILIPALVVLFNLHEGRFGLCGLKSLYDKDANDPEAAEINAEIADGRSLVDNERAHREREIHPNPRYQRGLTGRTRNIIDAYTSKYNRSLKPGSGRSSIHSVSEHPNPFAHPPWQEHGYHSDTTFTGQRTPPVHAQSDAQHDTGTTSHSALASASTPKKHSKFEHKSQSLHPFQNIQPIESTMTNHGSRQGRRVFGQPALATRPHSIQNVQNARETRSRSPSPTHNASKATTESTLL